MLESSEKQKIKEQLDKVLAGIQQDANLNIQKGMRSTDIIDRVTALTVNKIAPQSKMLLSSAYNMMMVRTLSDSYFSDAQHKAEFYRMDILSEIKSKFDFSVPSEIDYKKDQLTVKELTASGAVVVVGGIVSISMSTWIPVGIAAILAGIMAYVIKSNRATTNTSIEQIVTEYLQNVRKSFMLWIDSVEAFYDAKVTELMNRG